MDITRRCDYACRILRSVCQRNEEYVSVADIAEKEDIPYAFARSIQHDLVKGGLVKTTRGARGGIALGRPASDITMLEVLESMQGTLCLSPCALESSYCEKSGNCVYNKLWQGAGRLLRGYFGSVTLADLMEQGENHPVIKDILSTDTDVIFANADN